MAIDYLLHLNQEFGQVIIVTSIISFLLLLIGFFYPGRTRAKIFSQEYMDDYFFDEHKAYTGEQIQPGGYPDMGESRYADKLGYYEWLKFNNAQRSHYNFVEEIAIIVVLLLLSGIVFPEPSMALGTFYFLARGVYAVYYNTVQGPMNYVRIMASAVCRLIVLAAFVLTVVAGILIIINKE